MSRVTTSFRSWVILGDIKHFMPEGRMEVGGITLEFIELLSNLKQFLHYSRVLRALHHVHLPGPPEPASWIFARKFGGNLAYLDEKCWKVRNWYLRLTQNHKSTNFEIWSAHLAQIDYFLHNIPFPAWRDSLRSQWCSRYIWETNFPK